jgi:hypothetical protein
VALALGLLLAAGPVAAQEWHEAYRAGVSALARGDPARAVEALRRAVALRPEPGRNVLTYGTNVEPRYFPYLRLAEAYLALEQLDAARAALETSASRGREPADERQKLLARLDASLGRPAPRRPRRRGTARAGRAVRPRPRPRPRSGRDHGHSRDRVAAGGRLRLHRRRACRLHRPGDRTPREDRTSRRAASGPRGSRRPRGRRPGPRRPRGRHRHFLRDASGPPGRARRSRLDRFRALRDRAGGGARLDRAATAGQGPAADLGSDAPLRTADHGGRLRHASWAGEPGGTARRAGAGVVRGLPAARVCSDGAGWPRSSRSSGGARSRP